MSDKPYTTHTAMIFAAGMGSRLKPVTDHIPKPLIKIYNKPIIQHIIDQLIKENITRFIINGHYLKDQLFAFLDSYKKTLPSHIEIITVPETELKENGGSMLAMLPYVEEELFLGVNADIIWDTPILDKILNIWEPKNMDIVISLVDKTKDQYRELGDVSINDQGQIIWNETGGWIFSGIFLTSRRFLQTIKLTPPFKTIELWKLSLDPDTKLVERVYGAKMSGNWVEIGTLQLLKDLQSNRVI